MRQEFKQMMEENFGKELTGAQLWALTKFAKNVRLRCRNNTAFNNFMNQTFPHASFRTVTKTRNNRFTNQPETYPGLEISIKGAAPIVEDESEE